MRYFTHDLIAAANNWVKQSTAEHRKAEVQFANTVKKYHRQLEPLRSRRKPLKRRYDVGEIDR